MIGPVSEYRHAGEAGFLFHRVHPCRADADGSLGSRVEAGAQLAPRRARRILPAARISRAWALPRRGERRSRPASSKVAMTPNDRLDYCISRMCSGLQIAAQLPRFPAGRDSNIAAGEITRSSSGHVRAVTLTHLRPDRGIGEVELAQFLQLAQVDAERVVIHLPDQLGAVDARVGPFEVQVVGLAFVRFARGAQLLRFPRRSARASSRFDHVVARRRRARSTVASGV